jgi:hypothetical protein
MEDNYNYLGEGEGGWCWRVVEFNGFNELWSVWSEQLVK